MSAKHLPRAMIGGVVIVMGLYLLMNLAFLHVLSIPALAACKLPAADAAGIVFPAWSGPFVTVALAAHAIESDQCGSAGSSAYPARDRPRRAVHCPCRTSRRGRYTASCIAALRRDFRIF